MNNKEKFIKLIFDNYRKLHWCIDLDDNKKKYTCNFQNRLFISVSFDCTDKFNEHYVMSVRANSEVYDITEEDCNSINCNLCGIYNQIEGLIKENEVDDFFGSAFDIVANEMINQLL